MLLFQGIEVISRRSKIRPFTCALFMDVDTEVPRRKPFKIKGDLHPICCFLENRCSDGVPDPVLHVNFHFRRLFQDAS